MAAGQVIISIVCCTCSMMLTYNPSQDDVVSILQCLNVIALIIIYYSHRYHGCRRMMELSP